MALKRDFTHLIDVLQERLQQMKCSLDEITGRSQQKLDANRLFWRINDNFVFLTPKKGPSAAWTVFGVPLRENSFEALTKADA